jgi:hypothetical protein
MIARQLLRAKSAMWSGTASAFALQPVAILQTNSKHRSKFGNGCVRFEDGSEESRPGE